MLCEMGIGTKTAVGYGWFNNVKEVQTFKPQPAPNPQSNTSHTNKDRPTDSALSGSIELQIKEKHMKAAPKYGQYRTADIKIWLEPFRKDDKTLKKLKMFVDDCERAEKEGDNRYKDIAHLYEKAKKKLDEVKS